MSESLFDARYQTIVADPPWLYEGGFASTSGPRWGDYGDRAANAKSGAWETGAAKVARREMPYPAMSPDELRALPVEKFAAPSSRLFLWATSKHLPVALTLPEAWGFVYVQTAVWHKTGCPSPFGGSIAPNHAEFLIVAKRGKPKILRRWPSSVVPIDTNPSQLKHSQKPETFQDRIEQVSPGPYLELFARRPRLGWHVWGNEVISDVELTA